jgi:hypothetical protein
MDNATAEYKFITTFFALDQGDDDDSAKPKDSLLSPENADLVERISAVASEHGGPARSRAGSVVNPRVDIPLSARSKSGQAALDTIWKQTMDPVLQYTQVSISNPSTSVHLVMMPAQTFLQSILDSTPPVISLLTMIRLTEDVVSEVQKRSSTPVETFVFGLTLRMWPIFQKLMTENIDSLKKLTESLSSGYFSRGSSITDASLSLVSFDESSYQEPTTTTLKDLPAVYFDVQFVCYLDRTARRDNDLFKVRGVIIYLYRADHGMFSAYFVSVWNSPNSFKNTLTRSLMRREGLRSSPLFSKACFKA